MQNGAAQSILKDALRLPPDDRASIARALLDSVHGEVDLEIEHAWRQEIRRRIDAYDRGEVKAIPADEVRRSAERTLRNLRDAG